MPRLSFSAAVNVVQRWWRSCADKRLFHELILLIRETEAGISPDVLRKVNRAESYLWDDPAMSGRIRFRFDGTSFPPRIMWKMYCARTKVQYISGANMFCPGSSAANSAAFNMGKAQALRQKPGYRMRPQKKGGKSHEVQHFLKERSAVDSGAASFGGRNNCWRDLLQDLKGEDTTYYMGHSKASTTPLQTVVSGSGPGGNPYENARVKSQVQKVHGTLPIDVDNNLPNMFRPKSSNMLRREWIDKKFDDQRQWNPPSLDFTRPVANDRQSPNPNASKTNLWNCSSKQRRNMRRKPWNDNHKTIAQANVDAKWHGSVPVCRHHLEPSSNGGRPFTAPQLQSRTRKQLRRPITSSSQIRPETSPNTMPTHGSEATMKSTWPKDTVKGGGKFYEDSHENVYRRPESTMRHAQLGDTMDFLDDEASKLCDWSNQLSLSRLDSPNPYSN